MDLSTAFKVLKAYFKYHCAVANYLGLTKDHYRAIRNGRVNIPQRTAEYIIFKASEVSDSDSTVMSIVNVSTRQEQKSA